MTRLKPTDELSNTLNKAKRERELDHYLSGLSDQTTAFADYFFDLPAVKAMPARELIVKSGFDRNYFYQVKNRTRNPGRDKVLALCLAADLSLQELNRCLKLAGLNILYPRNPRDAIIIYAVKNGYDLTATNELLYERGKAIIA